MINKVIASYLLFACLVAIALKLGGVEGTLHFGSYFRAYLVQSNLELQNFKIAIPDIPTINNVGFLPWSNSLSANVIVLLNNFFNGFAVFINALVNLLNIIILVLNTLIQVIQLLFIFLKNLIVMKDNIITA